MVNIIGLNRKHKDELFISYWEILKINIIVSILKGGNIMERKLKLPIGIESFTEIRRNDYYYIDKTNMISDLLNNLGKVNLFTRPRRFGKSLNMDMLKCFFEVGQDKTLFDGLKITSETDLYNEYMEQYPVISVSLKGVSGLNFEEAKARLSNIIKLEFNRYKGSGQIANIMV